MTRRLTPRSDLPPLDLDAFDLDALIARTLSRREAPSPVSSDDVRHDRRVTQHGKPILFWRKDDPPQDHVRADVPPARRRAAIRALESGRPVNSYKGDACCRICGVQLGSSDLAAFGLIWPEAAEHYVAEHGVWVPELDALVAAAGRGHKGAS